MAEKTQNYANHRRFLPLWHFFAFPVLGINAIVFAIRLFRNPTGLNAWLFVVSLALFFGIFFSRYMAVMVQDRVIRLEEHMRMDRILPADLKAQAQSLRPKQYVGLRFASDQELADLTRRCVAGELKNDSDVKKAVKNWRPDHLRA